jgi:hypothetical protein
MGNVDEAAICQLEARRYAALAALQMYEDLLVTLTARAGWCRACVEAAGTDIETWRSLPGDERQAVVTLGARRLRRRGGNAGPQRLPPREA